jgi:HEAT repeat protein
MNTPALLRSRCLDPSYPTAAAAIRALGELGGTEGVTALIELLDVAGVAHLRGEICGALAATETEEALLTLSSRAYAQDPELREGAIAGLVSMELPQVLPHLGAALRRLLAEIEPLAASDGTLLPPKSHALVRLEELGIAIMNRLALQATFAQSRALQDALQSPSVEIRLHAALALADVAERDPDPRLVQVADLLRGDLWPWSFHLPRRHRGFREALGRINRAITATENRPIPSAPPGADVSTLPRPSDGEHASSEPS